MNELLQIIVRYGSELSATHLGRLLDLSQLNEVSHVLQIQRESILEATLQIVSVNIQTKSSRNATTVAFSTTIFAIILVGN